MVLRGAGRPRLAGMSMPTRVLAAETGGFIGHHLVTYLTGRGSWVRDVDLEYPEFTPVDADEFEILEP